MNKVKTIPVAVQKVARKLSAARFDALLVGGCVRDLMLGRTPNDWDVATNATPDEIQSIFPKSRYDNQFGTVSVYFPRAKLKEVHVTTYRVEEKYSDFRRPDAVRFVATLEQDLARRDFTINAMALQFKKSKVKNQNDNEKFKIVDPFNGQRDLESKIIRAVGNPDERFREDALRMMRAVRFAAELGFVIEEATYLAIKKNAPLLRHISAERIRDEFLKIIESPRPHEGIEQLRNTGLLQVFLPELLEGYNVKQNKHHVFDVYTHNLLSLKYAVELGFGTEVRLAALLHDIGKPRTKRGEYPSATFYHHEVVGARMTTRILERLRFPNEFAHKITHLVRHHLFYYDIGVVTESGVRRLLARVGKDHIKELLELRQAERLGSGVPKARPYRLRHLEYMLDKVSQDPITTSMLKLDGHDVMKLLNIEPGPKVGLVLNSLLEEVLDDPKQNTHEYLTSRTLELAKLDDAVLRENLKKLASHKERVDREIKQKYYVK